MGPEDSYLYFVLRSYRADIHLLVAEDSEGR